MYWPADLSQKNMARVKPESPTSKRLLAVQRAWSRTVLLLLLLAVHTTVAAHPILVPRPTATLADRVLQSESLVLAREDPARPFHYAVTKIIAGKPGSTSIDTFMPSDIRRRLAADPSLAVLFTRSEGRDEWRSLGIASAAYLNTVRHILSFKGEWTPNEANNDARLHELSSLLGHEDVRLHELAYLEIGRASYASIRKVGKDVPMQRVRAMMTMPVYFDWRGLDIMLLGLSAEEQDRARVLREMTERQALAITINLAAWATAYLEVTGTEGITQLETWYFKDKDRTREELRLITRALAGHANERSELREPVVAAYLTMLDTHPRTAPDIAHDLIAWQRWDLSERLQALRPTLARVDPLGVYKVNLYLQQARSHSKAARP